MKSSLDRRLLLRVAAAAVVVHAITGSVHFVVDRLTEFDDKALVLALSKREIEIGLVAGQANAK